MMKIKIYMLLMLAVLCQTSCLDKFPENAVAEDKAITNVNEADQAVIGIYSSFLNSALYSGYLTLLPDIQCDLVYAVNGYSNNFGDIWRWDILATNSEIEAVYGSLYALIGQCNFLLDNAKKLKPTLVNDDDVDRLESLCGEAYFARALAYSELIKLYCVDYKSDSDAKNQLGVVLRTAYYEEQPIVRSSLYDSYQLVLADLNEAAKYLALDEDYDPAYDGYLYNNAVYFNEYTVYALRARVALYMRDYKAAIEYSSKIIDSNYYALSNVVPQSSLGGISYYDYMWQTDLATEIIWKVGFTSTNYGGALGSVFFNYDYSSYKPDYVPAQWVLDLYSSSDGRYNAFFRTATTGYSHGLTWPLLYKYWGNQDLFNAAQLLNTSMPKVFRLSEQYLIRAEAYCKLETPDYSKAGRDISALLAARYTSGGSVALNAGNAMDIIEEERVKELYMEGFRLQDLKRWDKGFERKPQDQSLSHGSSLKVESDNPLFVWPIPQHEIESPGANIKPNESNR